MDFKLGLVNNQWAEIITLTKYRGARVNYEDNDPSCPLQLACKTPLLKVSLN